MRYIDLRSVRTWYEEQGAGAPLVLQHGGAVDSRFFEPNLGPLGQRFHVYAPDRRGHGTPDVDGPMSFEAMADETVAFLERVVGGPAHIVGHSNGAFVALLTALSRPDLVRRLVLVSGGFHCDGFVPEAARFDPDAVVAELGPCYGEVSPDGEEHELAIVPGTSHFLMQEKPALGDRIIIDFLTEQPQPTVAPIRRAPIVERSI